MSTGSDRKRRWRRLALLLALLLIGYGTYRVVRPDPNLKRVRQLQQEFAQAKDLTPEQRRERGQQMREAMAKLTPAQRETLAAEGQQRFQQELERYHRMSPQEKVRHLDERINQDEERRRRFAQQNPQGGPRPGGGNFAAGAGGSGGPGGRTGQPMSAEERDKRRKERIDRTTPEFRALMDQYRKDMNARRQQRGLTPRGG
jgi:hypothetical protein